MKYPNLFQAKILTHVLTFLICFVIICIASETINPLHFCRGGFFFICFMQLFTSISLAGFQE